MTLGDKLSKLRKESNYTQEQLADILGVSRQAISKWESNTAYPETEKLLKLGELYQCSMDYLLKDAQETPAPKSRSLTFSLNLDAPLTYERKSKRSLFGMPLWHINIGYGRKAKGIIAVGFRAKGVVSIGFFSLGLISAGVLSLGGISLGALAAGLLSAGALSAGIAAFGAISLGVVSIGALSVGCFSVGALAIGKYFALGNHARAMIALGDTKAAGSLFQKLGQLTSQEISTIGKLLKENTPQYLSWAREWIMTILK